MRTKITAAAVCAVLAAISALLPLYAEAAGTSAGTLITNTVSANYSVGGIPQSPVNTSASFRVDRVINLTVTKLADATISAGQANTAALFLVSNTSNTALRFSLSAISDATNTWSMNNVRVYRDLNNNGAWDAGDTPYADASTFGDVASDASITVMIVADTPSSVHGGQIAQYELLAIAVNAGTVVVSTATTGADTPAVDTVFADAAGSASGDVARDGKHSAAASFAVGNGLLSIIKTVSVSDQWGGTQPIPGAILHYTIAVTASGSGTAVNTVITDPLPPNTGYLGGTLRLGGALLSDAADLDAGDVGGTTANTVTVKLGNLTAASPVQTITFDVRIQ